MAQAILWRSPKNQKVPPGGSTFSSRPYIIPDRKPVKRRQIVGSRHPARTAGATRGDAGFGTRLGKA
jgi:hypothetical protein